MFMLKIIVDNLTIIQQISLAREERKYRQEIEISRSGVERSVASLIGLGRRKERSVLYFSKNGTSPGHA